MNAIVSEKGQITIPKKLRVNLGLETGSVLEFTEKNGQLILAKKLESDPIDTWLGFTELPGDKSVDAYMKSIRAR